MYDELQNIEVGDGWNGAEYTMFFNEKIIANGSIDEAQIGFDEDYFCLCNEGCYAISVGGGTWDEEITWELLDELGTLLVSGGAPGTVPFSLGENQDCTGCIDPLACNYNFSAIDDPESCSYLGCTIINALNHNSESGCDDGTCLILGDFDLDQDVDIADLIALLANFGCVGLDCYADLDGDGIVGIMDILIFLGLIDP